MPEKLKEKLDALLWRFLLAVERAEAILGEPLHPTENIDDAGERICGITRTSTGPDPAKQSDEKQG